MKCTDDSNQFLWKTVSALEKLPQCSSVHRIIGHPKVNKTHVQRAVILLGFLHHDMKGEQLVGTSTSLSKATLTLPQLKLNTWLDAVKNGPADDFAGDTQQ